MARLLRETFVSASHRGWFTRGALPLGIRSAVGT
jgi:hypothetical protein